MNRAELEAAALSGAEKAIRLLAKNTLVEGVLTESGKIERVAGVEWSEQKVHHLHLSLHDITLRLEGKVNILYDNGVSGFKDCFSTDLTVRVVINHRSQCRIAVKGAMRDEAHPGYGYEVDYVSTPTKM